MTPGRAFAIAPLAAPVAYIATAIADGLARGMFGVGAGLLLVKAAFLIGAPISYVATVTIGGIGYVLTRHTRLQSAVGTIVTGGLAGAASSFILAPSFHGELVSIPLEPWRGVICGCSVAAAWWRIARGPRSTRSSSSTLAPNTPDD